MKRHFSQNQPTCFRIAERNFEVEMEYPTRPALLSGSKPQLWRHKHS
jgi:hypothetical protein